MALWDEVVARISATKAIALTNPDGADDPATVDTDRAALAVADVEAAFRFHGEQAYDGTDERHVAVGVMGVIAFLTSYGATGSEAADKAMERFLEHLRALRNTGPRGRLSPSTLAEYAPTDEFATGEDIPPATDKRRFGGVSPENPQRGDPLELP